MHDLEVPIDQAMPAPNPLAQNKSQLNRAALKWLSRAKADVNPYYLHVLDLAAWGLQENVEGPPARLALWAGPQALCF
jgi:hypothetical protein